MINVKLDNVSVDFPIYGGTSRSLKNSLVHVGTGGRLATDAGNRKVVNAVRNISLEVRQGDRVGLIGSNGAGKTTLLRVMAGVYEPTKGIRSSVGHVVPLLGGSLGMDRELPGYDNIALRGRILGLTKKQIADQIDDIAEFTELEHFLHLPVRTYSAGMRVRLAFAITTSVSADVLLLDEALGAGDETFRKKARERLDGFIGRAGALVLATHSKSLMRRFCNKALWLDHGEARAFGDLDEVLELYQASLAQNAPERIERNERAERRRVAVLAALGNAPTYESEQLDVLLAGVAEKAQPEHVRALAERAARRIARVRELTQAYSLAPAAPHDQFSLAVDDGATERKARAERRRERVAALGKKEQANSE